MSTSKKGRPKQEQTKPIIFERFRSRVTRQLSMSAKTAADLDRYIKWACVEVDAEPDEALTLVLDQALAQLFQRDKLFQDALKEKEEETGKRTEGASPGMPPTAPSAGRAPQSRPAVGTGNGGTTSFAIAPSPGVVPGWGKGTNEARTSATGPGITP